MAITDGEENSSRKWSQHMLMAKIAELQKTDRWTFVFRVPRGYASQLTRRFGVPAGNILEWDQTEQGVQVATEATKQAFTAYYDGLKSGVRSTTKFYTNLTDVDIKTVKAALVDVSGAVNPWLTSQKEVIKDYCEKMSKAPVVKGAAFYQLTEPEREVQDYKQIVLVTSNPAPCMVVQLLVTCSACRSSERILLFLATTVSTTSTSSRRRSTAFCLLARNCCTGRRSPTRSQRLQPLRRQWPRSSRHKQRRCSQRRQASSEPQSFRPRLPPLLPVTLSSLADTALASIKARSSRWPPLQG